MILAEIIGICSVISANKIRKEYFLETRDAMIFGSVIWGQLWVDKA